MPTSFPGLPGQIITALQLFIAATSYSVETNAKTRAQYSKFSRASNSNECRAKSNSNESSTWPSRYAMLVIYSPSLITSVVLLLLGRYLPSMKNIPTRSLAAVLCAIHFAKRCLEVLFLHKYSGRTDKATPTQISVYYTLMTILVVYASGGNIDKDSGDNSNTMMCGTVLFAIGIIGNFYHHYLLAALRSKNTPATKYVAPRGGLFNYVATPHYLFELLGWLGIAICSNHLNVYLTFVCMSSYLSGRAVAQKDFNRRKFDEKDWPIERKNMIPFVF